MIQENKKGYYKNLRQASVILEIEPWLLYFCSLLIQTQERTHTEIEFLIHKEFFLTKYAVHMNERQKKVIMRLFQEAVQGFKCGLSAHNYQAITGVPSATITWDLTDLVQKRILKETEILKHTRYWLNLTRL